MMTLKDILFDLQKTPRPLTVAESNYLFDLTAKARLKSPTEQWAMLAQELDQHKGFNHE